MADLPISLLPTAEGLDPADLIPIVNNGVTKKIQVRTIGGTPLELGPTLAASSVPVTVAVDQLPIPVREVNKEATQVSLSLLGIPRSEVALGIFGDVNTYDVNPLEWTSYPQITGGLANTWGVKHLSAESAAQISCPQGWMDQQNDILYFSRLTSKRYFRYQPGRVSSGTFGVRLDTSFDGAPAGFSPETVVRDGDVDNPDQTGALGQSIYNKSATCKKWGCFDSTNGYYFEMRGDGTRDSFLCVRRTNSIQPLPIRPQPGQHSLDTVPFSYNVNDNVENYAGIAGQDGIIVRDRLVLFHAGLFDTTLLATSADIESGEFVTVRPYPGYVQGQEFPSPGILNFLDAHWKNFGSATVGQSRWQQLLQDLYRDWNLNGGMRVKREFASVYEYRVPRSCFNFDTMNGERQIRRWSDYFDGNVMGDIVFENEQPVYGQSVKNIDFTKVTMYKVEYSWYGAVGAQFLAYVPVSNSLARWVRIHHLRVSNQITSPSLGNPTLPFTYLNIGGAGKPASLNYVQRLNKYGASYLIDGGDKGTVNINTVATDNDKLIYPDRQIIHVNTLSANEFELNNSPRLNVLSGVQVIEHPSGVIETRGVFNSYHVGARLYGTTNYAVPAPPEFSQFSSDITSPGLTISDISHDGKLAFLKDNRPVGIASASIALTAVTARGTPIVGVRVRNTVNNIRNRSQVYPIRLSFGTNKRVLAQLVKNPRFTALSSANFNWFTAVFKHPTSLSPLTYGDSFYPEFNETNAGSSSAPTFDFSNITPVSTYTNPFNVPPLTARTVGTAFTPFQIPATLEETVFSHQVYFSRFNCVVPLRRANLNVPILGSFYGIKGILRLKSFGSASRPNVNSETDVNADGVAYDFLPGTNIRRWEARFTFTRLRSGAPQLVRGNDPGNDYEAQPVGELSFGDQFAPPRNLKRGSFIPELPIKGNNEILYRPSVAQWTTDQPLAAVQEDFSEERTAMPGTGEVLASFNVGEGGVDIDLSPYFGFDKQYLSFPLVEGGDPDSLFLVARAMDGNDTIAIGGGSMTWEEQ
jgi:hypothetical protein